MMYVMSSGEERAWEILSSLEPSGVCRNASVLFEENAVSYIVRSFCHDFSVCPARKTVKGFNSSAKHLIERYGYFFIHTCLWYLIHSKDIPLSNRLVKPVNLKGGEMFFRGSHTLPLDGLAMRYGDDKDAFLRRAKDLCAEVLTHGDASLRLFPMPRIPVELILWQEDDEFPPRTDLLLDSTCEIHLPVDIMWSIAMMSILVMM
jgi:Domain of unknown function (DUF3786)